VRSCLANYLPLLIPCHNQREPFNLVHPSSIHPHPKLLLRWSWSWSGTLLYRRPNPAPAGGRALRVAVYMVQPASMQLHLSSPAVRAPFVHVGRPRLRTLAKAGPCRSRGKEDAGQGVVEPAAGTRVAARRRTTQQQATTVSAAAKGIYRCLALTTPRPGRRCFMPLFSGRSLEFSTTSSCIRYYLFSGELLLILGRPRHPYLSYQNVRLTTM
jgi:hypothetical protein